MSQQVGRSSDASTRIFIVDDTGKHEVFNVLDIVGDIVHVRSAYLFEIGEELRVHIERDGDAFEAIAWVRSHADQIDTQITELELTERKTAG